MLIETSYLTNINSITSEEHLTILTLSREHSRYLKNMYFETKNSRDQSGTHTLPNIVTQIKIDLHGLQLWSSQILLLGIDRKSLAIKKKSI